MRWHKDGRRPKGGYWQCRVLHRERQRGKQWNLDPEKARARNRRYWHKTNGGYIRRRRRDLAAQRADIQAQLRQLDEEAQAC